MLDDLIRESVQLFAATEKRHTVGLRIIGSFGHTLITSYAIGEAIGAALRLSVGSRKPRKRQTF